MAKSDAGSSHGKEEEATGVFYIPLARHNVFANVVDIDHYRNGVAVETDYIIVVQWMGEQSGKSGDCEFEPFMISKTYSAFRSLSSSIKKTVEKIENPAKNNSSKHAHERRTSWNTLPKSCKDLVKFSEALNNIVMSESVTYFGKVNFTYVKHLAKSRKENVNSALSLITNNFPTDKSVKEVRKVAQIIETFFLTDHVIEDLDGSSITSKTREVISKTASKITDKASHLLSQDKPTERHSAPAQSIFGVPANGKGVSFKNVASESQLLPKTQKRRGSLVDRKEQEKSLMDMSEVVLDEDLDDDDSVAAVTESRRSMTTIPSSINIAQPTATEPTTCLPSLTHYIQDPLHFSIFLINSLYLFTVLSNLPITVTLDKILFCILISFSLGLNFDHVTAFLLSSSISKKTIQPPQTAPATLTTPLARENRRASSFLIKKVMSQRYVTTKEQRPPTSTAKPPISEIELPPEAITTTPESDLMSPLPEFPKGAELGSHCNCWSEPAASNYNIRGNNYLTDKKKIPSGPVLFPNRGVDLFLTDTCPENVGSNPGVLGGKLRDEPTFLINYRLPWGVLVFYHRIPELFLPYLQKKYNPAAESPPPLDTLTPSQRTVARFFLGDDAHRSNALKIVPVVVSGPWIVKSVVGGKPAIVGTKLPVNYVYQPPDPKSGKAAYLEADLDIVASAAARRILSVVRSHTQSLTIDLGFVIQGNKEDELPEQMLTCTRIHGLDPIVAPPLPAMSFSFFEDASVLTSEDDSTDTDE